MPKKTLDLDLTKNNFPVASTFFIPKPNEKPRIGPVQIPLLQGLAAEKNGEVTLYGTNTNGAGLDHIFSFTYYLAEGKTFERSFYYYGLKAYIQLAHGELRFRGAKFPYKCGVIVYTDTKTLPVLLKVFPLEKYPNLTIALVNWPYFSDQDGNINTLILRGLRFQAVDIFQEKNVHIRDADTLYVAILDSINILEKRKAEERFIDRYMELFHNTIFQWESNYLNLLPKIAARGKQIVFGSTWNYNAFYHSNIPYPILFQFPVRIFSEDYRNKPNPNQYLYMRGNKITSEKEKEISAIIRNIKNGKATNNLKKETKAVLNENTQKTIKNKRIARNAFFQSNYLRKRPFDIEIAAIANDVQKKLEAAVPPEQRKNETFFNFFKEKYMFFPKVGAFAGFVSVLENRNGIQDFWKLCVEYLLSRYFMVEDMETKKKVVSNEIFKRQIYDSSGVKIGLATSFAIGKDERMLLYGVAPQYLEKIFILPLSYSRNEGTLEKNFIADPNSYFRREVEPQLNAPQNQYFLKGIKTYKDWLDSFYKLYPTEKDFLDAVNTNLRERLVPYDIMREKSGRTRRNNALDPYSYPPFTVRRGGTRKMAKHIRSRLNKATR